LGCFEAHGNSPSILNIILLFFFTFLAHIELFYIARRKDNFEAKNNIWQKKK
jgi:hypothetical protein